MSPQTSPGARTQLRREAGLDQCCAVDGGAMRIEEVRLSGVSKRFTHPTTKAEILALKELEFKVLRGEVVSLLGPSGCGKTTVLNMIAGFDFPTAGQAYIENQPITGPGPDRGVVFQDLYLFDWLTVEENIGFPLKMRGVAPMVRKQQVIDFIDLVGLSGFAQHRPPELSGGMRQRVALARVLINEPRILLMDEPFAALDAQTRLFMQMWFLQVLEKLGSTALFITHDIDEAILVADRVCVMSTRPGRIVREMEVGLPRPRSAESLTSDRFSEVKRECLELVAREFGKGFRADTPMARP